MKTVWKFSALDRSGEWFVTLPQGSQILTVQLQNNTPCLWALVDPKEENVESVKIIARQTGDPSVSNSAIYISTVSDGYRVFTTSIPP